MSQLQLDDIQGIILSGYGHLPTACYLFLQVVEAAPAKAWLSTVVERTTNADPWPIGPNGKPQKPISAVNIAFTYEGLQKLEVPTEGFSVEFAEGIAGPAQPGKTANRSRRLGDTGTSDPNKWEFGGPSTPPVHILLLLFANTKDGIEALQSQLLPAPESVGLKVLAIEDTYRPEHDREPFGFRDGMSQPVVEGNPFDSPAGEGGQPPVKAGEFILGYHNEYNLIPPAPKHPKLGPNGSYLVFRKLEQDVAGFWNYLYKAAEGDQALAEYLAAKMVGRWPSGTPLTLSPEKDDPAIGNDPNRNNDFAFNGPDLYGYSCPVGAHIRRTNPRDALQPGPVESLAAVNKHRMLRRGRAYGPTYPADVLANLAQQQQESGLTELTGSNEGPNGIAFIAINADIKRQFEFIQQTWVNDPKFDGLYENRDPLLANTLDTSGKGNTMTIQRWPVRRQLENLPSFVTVKGGGYFFLPGLQALRFIASLNAVG